MNAVESITSRFLLRSRMSRMPTSGPHPDTDEGLFQLIRTRAGARRLAQFAFDPSPREEPSDQPALAGGYRGIRVLGEGASGVVYLATHPETQRLVAFKLFQRLGRKAADRAHREIEGAGGAAASVRSLRARLRPARGAVLSRDRVCRWALAGRPLPATRTGASAETGTAGARRRGGAGNPRTRRASSRS